MGWGVAQVVEHLLSSVNTEFKHQYLQKKKKMQMAGHCGPGL
jgi:hypothetical protein